MAGFVVGAEDFKERVLLSRAVILHRLSTATQRKVHYKRDREATFWPKEVSTDQIQHAFRAQGLTLTFY